MAGSTWRARRAGEGAGDEADGGECDDNHCEDRGVERLHAVDFARDGALHREGPDEAEGESGGD